MGVWCGQVRPGSRVRAQRRCVRTPFRPLGSPRSLRVVTSACGGGAEERGRTGFEGEGGDIHDYLRARLEDDEKHADWARDAIEFEAVVQLSRVRDGTRGVW